MPQAVTCSKEWYDTYLARRTLSAKNLARSGETIYCRAISTPATFNVTDVALWCYVTALAVTRPKYRWRLAFPEESLILRLVLRVAES